VSEGRASSTEDGTTVGTDALLHGKTAEQSERKERNRAEDAETTVFIF